MPAADPSCPLRTAASGIVKDAFILSTATSGTAVGNGGVDGYRGL